MPEMNLGTCCVCELTERVNNILMLSKLCPTPGRGWGCLQCHKEMNGAFAVVCDPCFSKHEGIDPETWLKFACVGAPATDGRVLITELQGEFDHVLALHPEAVEYYDSDISNIAVTTNEVQ